MTPRHLEQDRRSGEDRRETTDDPRVKVSIVLAVLGCLFSYLLGLFSLYNAMTGRLTALEANRANDAQRIERIEAKIDRLLERER